MDIRAFLEKACEEGREIRIIYHGGSNPGTSRRVIPELVTDHIIKAFCLQSELTKTYVISKIDLYEE